MKKEGARDLKIWALWKNVSCFKGGRKKNGKRAGFHDLCCEKSLPYKKKIALWLETSLTGILWILDGGLAFAPPQHPVDTIFKACRPELPRLCVGANESFLCRVSNKIAIYFPISSHFRCGGMLVKSIKWFALCSKKFCFRADAQPAGGGRDVRPCRWRKSERSLEQFSSVRRVSPPSTSSAHPHLSGSVAKKRERKGNSGTIWGQYTSIRARLAI